jgi:hypothetical protein
MESPPVSQQTVSYQIPRGLLVGILFRRMFFRARRLRFVGLLLLAAALFYFAGRGAEYLAYACIGFIFLSPWILYRAIARAIDQNSQFTDPKTLTFSPAGLLVVGPNYKSELDWSMFKAFSENDANFYLHLTDTGFDSVIPKSAFTPAQQEEFRQYAKTRIA